VFQAFRKHDRTPVAVKRQFLGGLHGNSVPIMRETSVLNALNGSPNIVGVHHCFVAIIEKMPEVWSVLDYYPFNLEHANEGEEYDSRKILGTWCDVHRNVIFQILRGLNALHRRDIVHRDLKPHNVLVQREPELKVAICDFGQSRPMRGLVCHELTQTSQIHEKRFANSEERVSRNQPPVLARTISVEVMTSNYRSPEMFGFVDTSEMKIQGFKSMDIYAVGLIWAALLTGEHVLTHHDQHFPEEFLLLENLKRVDAPCNDRIEEELARARFNPKAASFIMKVLSGSRDDRDAIRKDWSLFPERETKFILHRNMILDQENSNR